MALSADDVDHLVAWSHGLTADLHPTVTSRIRRFTETGAMDPVVVVLVRGSRHEAELVAFVTGDVELARRTDADGVVLEHAAVHGRGELDEVRARFRGMALTAVADGGSDDPGQSPRNDSVEPGSD